MIRRAPWALGLAVGAFGFCTLQNEVSKLLIPDKVEIRPVLHSPNVRENHMPLNAYVGRKNTDVGGLISGKSLIHDALNFAGAQRRAENPLGNGKPPKGAQGANPNASKRLLQKGRSFAEICEFNEGVASLRHGLIIAIQAVEIIDPGLLQETVDPSRGDHFRIDMRSLDGWQSLDGILSGLGAPLSGSNAINGRSGRDPALPNGYDQGDDLSNQAQKLENADDNQDARIIRSLFSGQHLAALGLGAVGGAIQAAGWWQWLSCGRFWNGLRLWLIGCGFFCGFLWLGLSVP